MLVTEPLPDRCYGSDLVEQAQELLRAVSHISFCDLRCEYRHGLLILRGQVDSYYEKQLPQEAVARLEGVDQVVNEIEVVCGDSDSQWRSMR